MFRKDRLLSKIFTRLIELLEMALTSLISESDELNKVDKIEYLKRETNWYKIDVAILY